MLADHPERAQVADQSDRRSGGHEVEYAARGRVRGRDRADRHHLPASHHVGAAAPARGRAQEGRRLARRRSREGQGADDQTRHRDEQRGRAEGDGHEFRCHHV